MNNDKMIYPRKVEMVECNKCGCIYEIHIFTPEDDYNYCPNCGANVNVESNSSAPHRERHTKGAGLGFLTENERKAGYKG